MSKDLAVQEPKSELVIAAEKIKSGLVAFETRKVELTILRDEVDKLDITSVEDKAGIKQLTEGRKKVKAARVEIEKEGKSMRDPLTALAKSISAKEKELIDIVEPTEKKLKAKEDWVKSENERIADEEKQREAKRVQDRINRLAEYGYAIDVTFLTIIDDDQFEKVVDNAKSEHEKEQALAVKRANVERAQREQDEKDRQELQALRKKAEEAERIIREREEEEARKEAEFKRKKNEAAEAESKKAEEEKKAIVKKRLGDLTNLGLKFNFEANQYEGFAAAVHYFDITGYDNEKWDKMIADLGPHIERYKKEEADKLEEKRQNELKEAAAKALEEQKERDIEALRVKAEEFDQASDKDKMVVILGYIDNMPRTEFKSARYKKLFSEVVALQNKVVDHIRSRT